MMLRAKTSRAMLLVSIFTMIGSLPLGAQTATRVMVRVTANDAKIVGSGVGGANVTIRNAETGALLAEGVQGGGTGNTGLIMGSRERGATIYDTDGAGGFLAEIQLREPTWVEITAEGPLGTPEALRTATRTTLLIPGRDVLGDGFILELLGFTVELTDPQMAQGIGGEIPIEVGARVTMLCGCPTSPGGTWDSDGYDIVARVLRGGRVEQEVTMTYSGQTSMYGGTLEPVAPGVIEIEVLAMDQARGNFGAVRRRFEVR